MLEDRRRGQVAGISGIAASAGVAHRFDNCRNEMVVHTSAALNAGNRIHTLLTSFRIDPAVQHTPAPQRL